MDCLLISLSLRNPPLLLKITSTLASFKSVHTTLSCMLVCEVLQLHFFIYSHRQYNIQYTVNAYLDLCIHYINIFHCIFLNCIFQSSPVITPRLEKHVSAWFGEWFLKQGKQSITERSRALQSTKSCPQHQHSSRGISCCLLLLSTRSSKIIALDFPSPDFPEGQFNHWSLLGHISSWHGGNPAGFALAFNITLACSQVIFIHVLCVSSPFPNCCGLDYSFFLNGLNLKEHQPVRGATLLI